MGTQFMNAVIIMSLKTLLFVFNVSIWLVALFMLGVALWGCFDLFRYMELPPELSEQMPNLIISICTLVVVLSSFAFKSIYKGQTALLCIYGALLLCFLMVNVGMTVAIVCYKPTFTKGLYDGLSKDLVNYDPTKIMLDIAQSRLGCCGVNNYTDWVKMSPQRVIPLSCCLVPECITANYNEVHQKGCYYTITKYMDDNKDVIIGTMYAFSVYPFMGSLISCYLANFIKKSRDNVTT